MVKKPDKKLFMIELIFIFLLFVMICLVIPHGDDYNFHCGRIQNMAHEFRIKGLGAVPIRMYTEALNGYGYANPLFYGDVFLYFPAILSALGLSVVTSYKIMCLLIMTAAFLSMLYCSYRITRSVNTALFTAGIYSFGPYFATDLIVRSAIGESLAFIFIPLAFLGLHSILYNYDKDSTEWLWLPIGMAGLILSHVISTVLFAIVILVICCVKIKAIFTDSKKLLRLTVSVFIVIALSSFFVLPMLEQMKFQKLAVTSADTYSVSNFVNRKVPYLGLFIPHGWLGWMHDALGIDFGAEYVSWYPAMLGYALIICLLLRIKNQKKLSGYGGDGYLIGFVLTLVLCMPFVPLSYLKPALGFIQFIWRFYIVAAFCMTIYFMKLYQKLDIVKASRFILVGMCAVFILTVVSTYASDFESKYIKRESPEKYNADDIGSGEYLPAGTDLDRTLQRGMTVMTNYDDFDADVRRNNGITTVRVRDNTHDDSKIEAPLIMYKGYLARSGSGDRQFEVSKSENGLVSVDIGGYNGSINIIYAGTAIQKISWIISVISFALLIIYGVIKRKKGADNA